MRERRQRQGKIVSNVIFFSVCLGYYRQNSVQSVNPCFLYRLTEPESPSSLRKIIRAYKTLSLLQVEVNSFNESQSFIIFCAKLILIGGVTFSGAGAIVFFHLDKLI